MAPHSSTLAWKILWTGEPGRPQSMESLGVGHDWATSLSLFSFMHQRRKWQPTPVFLPGESQGRGTLVGCCLWGHTGSDMTEATWQAAQGSQRPSPMACALGWGLTWLGNLGLTQVRKHESLTSKISLHMETWSVGLLCLNFSWKVM